MHTKVLSIEDPDKGQSQLFKELNNINKGGKPIKKCIF